MIDTKFFDQLKRFSLIIRKRVTSSYSGARRSIAYGRGLTIEDYREYTPGDDLRALDWKVFARTNKLYIKQFEEERTVTAHIIVDQSASMDFGSGIKKFDFAAMLGLGYAYLAMKDNDKFEFSTFSEDLSAFKAKRGMSQLASTVEYLNKLKIRGHSNFEKSMSQYKKLINTRALVVLFSDFLFNLEEIKHGLLRLGKHELVVVQVLDKQERELKLEGDVDLKDSETNEELRTYVSRRLRQKFQSKLDDHSENVHDICDNIGAEFHVVYTDEDIFDSFFRILKR